MRTFLFISLIDVALNLKVQSVEKHIERGIEHYNDSALQQNACPI